MLQQMKLTEQFAIQFKYNEESLLKKKNERNNC